MRHPSERESNAMLICFRLILTGFHWFVKWSQMIIENQLFLLETSLMF